MAEIQFGKMSNIFRIRGGHKAHVTTLIGQATEVVSDEVKFETLENLRDEIIRQRNIIHITMIEFYFK